MEDRRKLVGDLDRYGAILGLITDPQPIAAPEQLIRETRYPVACKFGRGRKRYYRSDRDCGRRRAPPREK